VVADASKHGVVTPCLICPIEDVHVLVTDSGATDEAVAGFTSREVEVLRA
jgi:DeoR family transcriptional regulator, aga operon transcriptional repressor